MLLENIANFSLAFSHKPVVLPLVIIGYIWFDRKIFFHSICLILISMIFNNSLKVSFQVPLSPTLGKEGFAFPSGHMQAAVVLYGCLYKFIANFTVRLTIVIILAGIAFGLMYFGYHNLIDILGAIFFGSLLIFIYIWLTKKYSKNSLLTIVLLFNTTSLLYIASVYKISPHLWMAYYTLIGVMVSEYYCANKITLKGTKNKIIATVFCFAILFIINKLLSIPATPTLLIPVKWFLLGFCIPYSLAIPSYLHNKATLIQHNS